MSRRGPKAAAKAARGENELRGANERNLISGAESPIEYPGQKPEEIVAEDRIIQSFPFQVPEEKIKIIDINEVLER